MHRFNRFVILSVLAGLLLSACASPTPTPVGPTAAPQVITVRETVVVESTPQVVERLVTTTPEPEKSTKTGGTLIVATGAIKQFDPIAVADDPSMHAVSLIFSLLFRNEQGTSMPDLAVSWEYVDEANTTLVFKLRKGVMWHDDNAVFPLGQSREVVADDVVFSLKRLMETPGANVPADLKDSYLSVEALDDYTVQLQLSKPNALLFSNARGLSQLAIVPPEAIEQLGDKFATNPIGSGPFKFLQYKPDDSLTLVRNDLYWKRPYLDQVIFRIIPDNTVALTALETGEIDTVTLILGGADVDRLSDDPRFVLHQANCPVMTQIVFDMRNPLFADMHFRKAIAHALDGDAINRNAFGAAAESGAGQAGPGVPGYVPTLRDAYFQYDPDQARELFAELGWTDSNGDGVLDKDGEALRLPLEIWNFDPMPRIGEAVAAQLAEAGVQIDLQTVEFGTWLDDFQKGGGQMWLLSGYCGEGGLTGAWGRNGFYTTALGYDEPELFNMLDESNQVVDPAERSALLQAVTERIYSQYWGVSLGFYHLYQASRTWVHDYSGTLWFMNLVTDKNNVWVDR